MTEDSEKIFHYVYPVVLCLAFLVLVISSWNAPISGDEYVHVQQAQKNIRYLKTFGADKAALNTPISRLKHYGQSFDTLTTWLAGVWHIDNLYRFRHVSNALVAWLIIYFSSLLAIRLTHSKVAAMLTVVLYLVTLRFMGHASNNLKDIPFTFAMLFALYHTIKTLEKMPQIPWKSLLWVVMGAAMAISVRIGGLLAVAFFVLFSALYLYYLWVSGEISTSLLLRRYLARWAGVWFGAGIVSYVIGVLPWPWALENIIQNPWTSLALMRHYPTTVRQIFEGQLYWSDDFPWYYLFKYLLITLPVVVLMGFGVFFVLPWRNRPVVEIVYSIFLLIAAGFPLFYAVVGGANVYGGWRQLLFVLPPLVVLAATGWCRLFGVIAKWRWLKLLTIAVFVCLLYQPMRFFIVNYPYQYTYFNVLTGGTRGAFGQYETDYYFTGFKRAYEFIDRQEHTSGTVVAANFVIPEYYKNKPYKPKLIDYYNRSAEDWDYAVIGNTFLHPYQLRQGLWPPSNAVFVSKAAGVPMVAVLKRNSKADLRGAQWLVRGDMALAIRALDTAVARQPKNVSVRLLRAKTYYQSKNISAMQKDLAAIERLYPNNEQAMELKGLVAMDRGKMSRSAEIFKQIIAQNKRFFRAYVDLARMYNSSNEPDKAIFYLKKCLRLNPYYRLAYREYGQILIAKGDKDLGAAMLKRSSQGTSRYDWK